MAGSGGSSTQVTRTYDWAEVSPSVAIIETIAAYEGETLDWAVESRDPPLNDCLDADALDALFSNDSGFELSFSFSEYYIQISGNAVAITPGEAAQDD